MATEDQATYTDTGLLAWALHAGFTDTAPTASMWRFATSETRDWGGISADRILRAALADQLINSRLADIAEPTEFSTAWQQWAKKSDGCLAIPHGESLCRA